MEQKYDPEQVEQIARHYQAIIELLGEDITRQGLEKTPIRAAKALLENTRGYKQQPDLIAQSAIFDHPGSEMVIVRDIEFHSLCEHHILPFFGTASIGYIPNGSIIGLSKLARIVDAFARRFQVQERLTKEICETIDQQLNPLGVIVVCRAQHLCMQMRGVEKQNAYTITTHYSGKFSDLALRQEFMQLISR